MTKEEMQARMDAAVSKMEANYESLKADLDKAGDAVSEETREAVAKAKSLLEQGRAKARQLADATDEEFEEMKDSAEENWHELADSLESGWHSLTTKIRNLI